MSEERFLMFRNRLHKVFRHVSRQAKRMNVSCFRVYDHDLPEFPFRIEVYENKLYVAEYKRRHNLTEDDHDAWIQESINIMCDITEVPHNEVYLKLRQRKPGRLGQYQQLDKQQEEFVVRENGLRFLVNLVDYLDTGLFLDHRITREMVKDQCDGKRVLNLFAYTGSFSAYAAAGGASEVVTVDLSNTYINWAKKNLSLNGYNDETKYKFVVADVLQYLDKLKAGTFDIIILDPPTFSNSKKMDTFLDVQRDHVMLINNCIRLLRDAGKLYFSTNFSKFEIAAEEINAGTIKDITKATTPFDFEGKLERWCYLIW